MTSLRRRLLNAAGSALLVLSLLFGAGCQSRTASEPIGKLSREDTIAYLILSYRLAVIRERVKVPFTVCISTGTHAEMLAGYPDPSVTLVARLTEANAGEKGTLKLKPASACAWNGPAVTDRSTGLNAFLVHSTEASDSRNPECGQFEGGWHGGALYGGGHFYTVEEVVGTITVKRTNCRWAS